ncbi:ABC-2 type transport system ATP-binding protein [Luteococcus japonicus]|uniref:ABC-2 type transport system ATP-binding protein n=1 Tax=Luteococcus japonicus TaxID=33984 RepID=A0A3N1ZVH5_9ACTN|nr:ABC transporter ATP-binding protein [Luteococcus japonicus]ROR54768.1 ABC-2 type transport system ATP-binding protein [Luteococcus japonicus]
MASIELVDVHKHFGPRTHPVKAVDGLTTTIEPGEIVALLGPNGAGKTTAIDMVLGLTEPTSGTVRVFDTTPRRAVQAGRIGAVMQTGGLLRDLSVRETLTSIAALQRVPDRVDEVLEQAKLTALAGRRVSKCSGGEQQRIKMALALLTDPDLLVLDEPTAGMDVGARRDFWASMREQARAGRTIVFATHYLEEAQDFAQRIILIGKGRLLADGPVAEVQAMTSGRSLAASFPHPLTEGDPQLAALRALPGVTGIEVNGSRVSLTALGSDAVARHLLESGAHDLVIEAPTLESAFLALTQEK